MIRSTRGITMIGLVLTIITIMVLTGVVINSVVGERSVIKQAVDVRDKKEEQAAIEEMNMVLASLNMEILTAKDDEGIAEIFNAQVSNGVFENFYYLGERFLIKYNGNYYDVREDDTYKDQYRVHKYLSSNLAENIPGNSYIITEENADDAGNLTFELNSEYYVIDKISAEKFNFVIPSAQGDPDNAINLYLTEDIDIDNIGHSRSAIELEEGAILNMYITNQARVSVNSAYGEQGQAGGQKDEDNHIIAAKGGPGGYAGIHVPETAILNIFGDGTLIAYGGDAGAGNAVSSNLGSGGGGGAGAGIGGNGGKGGDANTTEINGNDYARSDNGENGEAGGNCGTINIYNSVTVYAYGGAGGSGGKASASAGSGGGGYPAAGIGGGGAGAGGGNHCDGAGGFSGGGAQYNVQNGINGLGGGMSTQTSASGSTKYGGPDSSSSGGGGYFTHGIGRVNTQLGIAKVGGQGSGSCHWFNNTTKVWWNDHAGDGGVAGNGGKVTVSTTAKVFAYNGDMITTGKDSNRNGIIGYDKDGNSTGVVIQKVQKQDGTEIVPCPIFAQAGIKRAVYRVNYPTALNYADLKNVLESSETSILKSGYNGYGVGSGAGYVENSNGFYVINNTFDDKKKP